MGDESNMPTRGRVSFSQRRSGSPLGSAANELAEVVWNGTRGRDPLARHRVIEGQSSRVQRHAGEELALATGTIEYVADEWMAQVRKVDADLMRAPV